MATQTVTTLVDDIDGSSDDVVTCAFGLGDAHFEIDLNAAHREELESVLAKFVAAGRQMGTARRMRLHVGRRSPSGRIASRPTQSASGRRTTDTRCPSGAGSPGRSSRLSRPRTDRVADQARKGCSAGIVTRPVPVGLHGADRNVRGDDGCAVRSRFPESSPACRNPCTARNRRFEDRRRPPMLFPPDSAIALTPRAVAGSPAGGPPPPTHQRQVHLVDDLDQHLVRRGGHPADHELVAQQHDRHRRNPRVQRLGRCLAPVTARPRMVSQAPARASEDCSGSWARSSDAPPAAAIRSRRIPPSAELQCLFARRSSSSVSPRRLPVSGSGVARAIRPYAATPRASRSGQRR